MCVCVCVRAYNHRNVGPRLLLEWWQVCPPSVRRAEPCRGGGWVRSRSNRKDGSSHISHAGNDGPIRHPALHLSSR